jgi:spermidine/putrescine transport system ATP-binding protein
MAETKQRSAAVLPPETDTEQAFVGIDSVRKQFDDQVALESISLGIRQGEFITLLGPSGCGKTTLLRVVAGFEQPTSGRVLLDGRDITRVPPERRPFNMVFQSYALFPHMNVFDNVAYGLRTARVREPDVRRRVTEALSMVGLDGHATRAVGQLSGGMSQRVALVRAIVMEPSVLLLDEPLGALDLQLRKRMQVELRAIQSRVNTTFVYVTHDQEEALIMSHRVVLMRDGAIVQVGTPEQVYKRPATRFVAEFVGETSLVDCRTLGVDAATVTVELAGGARASFPYYGMTTVAVDDLGLIALRPEHLRFVAVGDPGATLNGEVSDVLFVGAITYHVVTLSSGAKLRVAADSDRDLAVGAPVAVAINPGAGAYVPAEHRSVDPDA